MKADLVKISMFPTVNLKEKNNIEKLINLFIEEDKLLPDKWGYDERIRLNYNKEDIVKYILSDNFKSNEIFIYRNKKTIKYDGFLSMQRKYRAYLRFNFQKNLSQKYWKKFFDLSDEISNIVKPRFATACIWCDELKIDDKDKSKFQHMLHSRSVAPASFLSDGPLGISTRTYLNEEIIELFGMDYLLKLPGYVEKLKWGGLRIDLVKEPWNSEMNEIFEAWIKAMNYLRDSKVFSEYIYKGDFILADIITSEKWKEFLANINKL